MFGINVIIKQLWLKRVRILEIFDFKLFNYLIFGMSENNKTKLKKKN